VVEDFAAGRAKIMEFGGAAGQAAKGTFEVRNGTPGIVKRSGNSHEQNFSLIKIKDRGN
jgi:hypothetical protein